VQQLVTIELFGQTFTFTSESEAVGAKDVVDFLVREVTKVEKQLKNQSAHISKLVILLLAALNIVNEHMELKKNHSILLENISSRSEDLLQLLDNRVKSNPSKMMQVEIS
jgi:cell division protein ZapA (FtsZ GTPase activity inhibitor)